MKIGFGLGLSDYRLSGGAGYIGILDLYPNAAAAYSVRRLANAHTGPLIRVRRSSDNAEQDIGFTGTGDLDETALTAFVGANDGFVVTWYDQSGSANNATQSTASSQPKIVNSGTVLKLNGKPTIYWDSTDYFVFNTAIDSQASDSSMFLAYKLELLGNAAILINVALGTWHFLNYVSSSLLSYGYNFIFGNPFQTTDYILVSANNKIGVNLSWFKNNVNVANYANPSANGVISLEFPSRVYGTSPMYATELIIYNINQEDNINDIDTNINTYYGIY